MKKIIIFTITVAINAITLLFIIKSTKNLPSFNNFVIGYLCFPLEVVVAYLINKALND